MARMCEFCKVVEIPADAPKSKKYHSADCAYQARLKQNRERAPEYKYLSQEAQEKKRQWQKKNREVKKILYATQNEVKRLKRLAASISEPVVITALEQIFDQLFSGSADCQVEITDKKNSRRLICALSYRPRPENPETTLLECTIHQGPASDSHLEFTDIQIRSVFNEPFSSLRAMIVDMKRLR